MKYIISTIIFVISLYAENIAIVKEANGQVYKKTYGETTKIEVGHELTESMILITKKGTVTIVFNDNSTVVLGEFSILDLKKFFFKPLKNEFEFELFLSEGDLTFESGKIGELAPEKFILKTPEGVVAIRGTKFYVQARK